MAADGVLNQATVDLTRGTFTSSLTLETDEMAIISVMKDEPSAPLLSYDFSSDFCDDRYLFMDAVEGRDDILILRFGCIVGEDKKRIHGEVLVLHVGSDEFTSVWTDTEVNLILRDECLDDSYIEVFSVDDDSIQIVRVTHKQDVVTDVESSEFECPTSPRKEVVLKTLFLGG